jgi:glutathione S-transferase
MQLYSGPLSLFSAKVRIAFAEKSVAHDLISVPWTAKDGYTPKHPVVERFNPKRQVPVLVDGDVVLYDSTVILEYLEDRFPEPPLYPVEHGARARCRQLELESDEVHFAPVRELIGVSFYPRQRGERPDEAREVALRGEIAAYHERLSKHLGDQEFLCGAFGVADISHFLTAFFAAGFGAAIDPRHETLQAWLRRVGDRASVGQDVAEMTKALAA